MSIDFNEEFYINPDDGEDLYDNGDVFQDFNENLFQIDEEVQPQLEEEAPPPMINPIESPQASSTVTIDTKHVTAEYNHEGEISPINPNPALSIFPPEEIEIQKFYYQAMEFIRSSQAILLCLPDDSSSMSVMNTLIKLMGDKITIKELIEITTSSFPEFIPNYTRFEKRQFIKLKNRLEMKKQEIYNWLKTPSNQYELLLNIMNSRFKTKKRKRIKLFVEHLPLILRSEQYQLKF